MQQQQQHVQGVQQVDPWTVQFDSHFYQAFKLQASESLLEAENCYCTKATHIYHFSK
jgi:hypothetical protein